MLVAQVLQLLLRLVQLFLGIGNQLAVSGDLLVGRLDFVIQQGHFLIDGVFLGHHGLHVAVVGVILTLDGIQLRLDLGVFFFQRVDLLLNFRRGRGIDLHGQGCDHQCHGKQHRQKGNGISFFMCYDVHVKRP